MRSRRRAWTPWLAVLLLGACTFGSGPQAATSGPTAPSSAGSTTPTSGTPGLTTPTSAAPSASRTGSGVASPSASAIPSPSAPRSSRLLRVTATARIPLAGQTYGRGVVLFGRYAAWMGCNGCQRTFTEPTTLYVADLATRRVRAVATAPRHGEVVLLGGSGSRLVYIEGNSTRKWTIYAVDVAGGARSALAGSTAASGDLAPVAAVGDGQLAWQTFGKGPGDPTHGPVNAIDLRTGARRTVSRDLPGVLGAFTRAGLVYRAPSAAGAPLDQGPTDAFLLRPDRRQAVVLSDTHDVRDIVADDTTAAWQTNDGPDAATWAAPLDGQGPVREFYRGGTGDRAVGAGFLAVVTSGDDPVVLLYPLTGGPVVALGDIPGEFDAIAAEGARLAYIALPVDRGVQPDAKHPIALVVDTVAPPGS
jgi:hypothetical protein